jgi:hypothetical protein
VVSSGAAYDKTNVFPGMSWVHSHVVDLGAEVSCPACFGNEYFVLDIFVETGKCILHCVGNSGREIDSGAGFMDLLVAFIDWGGNVVTVGDEPVVPLDLMRRAVSSPPFLISSWKSLNSMELLFVAARIISL